MRIRTSNLVTNININYESFNLLRAFILIVEENLEFNRVGDGSLIHLNQLH